MKYGILLSFALILFIGCSSSKKSSHHGDLSLNDLLTDFSVAVNENDFKKAISYLKDEEKDRLLESNGQLSEKDKKRLKALRLHRLIKNRSIRMEGNKIAGIYNALPNLEHGKKKPAIVKAKPAPTIDSAITTPEEAPQTEPTIEANQAPSIEKENTAPPTDEAIQNIEAPTPPEAVEVDDDTPPITETTEVIEEPEALPSIEEQIEE